MSTTRADAVVVRPQSNPFLHDQRKRRIVGDVLSHALLILLSVIWILPIVWVVLESFNKNAGPYNEKIGRAHV